MNTPSIATRPLGLAPALAAPLAGAAEMMLEEITVTANRRETNLMDTPVAVSSFDADTRELLGIYNRFDLEQRTPSLTITDYKISIRGVGRPNNAVGSDPGVGGAGALQSRLHPDGNGRGHR